MSLQTPYYPGIDYNADKGPEMNAVSIAFISISFVTLVLRFGSRLYTKISLWADDWIIVNAAILSWAYSGLVIAAVQDAYYGQHIGHSNPAALSLFGKMLYALAIIYPPALVLSKLSLIALYWRVFRVTKAARTAMIIGAVLNIAWGIAALLVGIFSCWPIAGNWDFTISKTCIDYPPFFLSNEAITIVLDLYVLLLPIFWISRIQRTIAERLSLSITFLLGLVATVVSALRLWRLVYADTLPADDPTYTESDAGLWAVIELNLWILVASIPALRPGVVKGYQKITGTGKKGRKEYDSQLRTDATYSSYTTESTDKSGASSKRKKSLFSPSTWFLSSTSTRSTNSTWFSTRKTSKDHTMNGTVSTFATTDDKDVDLEGARTGTSASFTRPTATPGSANADLARHGTHDSDFAMRSPHIAQTHTRGTSSKSGPVPAGAATNLLNNPGDAPPRITTPAPLREQIASQSDGRDQIPGQLMGLNNDFMSPTVYSDVSSPEPHAR